MEKRQHETLSINELLSSLLVLETETIKVGNLTEKLENLHHEIGTIQRLLEDPEIEQIDEFRRTIKKAINFLNGIYKGYQKEIIHTFKYIEENFKKDEAGL